MSRYIPPDKFNVPMILLIPKMTIKNAVAKKEYLPEEQGILFFGSFRTFGGTESKVNGVYSIINTATIDARYKPEIKGNCRVKIGEAVYDIIGEPENINMENLYLQFKVREVKGGV